MGVIPEGTGLSGGFEIVSEIDRQWEIVSHSAVKKTYKKESPGTMGHWLTKAGPSISFVPAWKKPCQCYVGSLTSVQDTPKYFTHNRRCSAHRRIRELIDHIELFRS